MIYIITQESIKLTIKYTTTPAFHNKRDAEDESLQGYSAV
jgi:hypothetical protein